MRRRLGFAVLLVATALLALGAAAQPAGAAVTGGCVVTINGENVNKAHSPGTAFEFTEDEVVRVVGTSSAPVDSYDINMVYGLITYPAKSGSPTGDDTTWAGEVKVGDYTRYGVGIYRVEGTSSGAAPCSGWAYIKIKGPFPLTTVAGGAAAVLSLFGIGGMVSATRPPKPGRGGRGGRGGQGHRWRGALFGAMAGAGVAVLLQQFGVVPMTPAMMVGMPVGTAMVGLALGWPNALGTAAATAAA